MERGREGARRSCGGDYKEIKGRQRERREGIVVSSHEEGEEEKGGGRPTKRTQRQLELTRRQSERRPGSDPESGSVPRLPNMTIIGRDERERGGGAGDESLTALPFGLLLVPPRDNFMSTCGWRTSCPIDNHPILDICSDCEERLLHICVLLG
jgi:hypothetical protein